MFYNLTFESVIKQAVEEKGHWLSITDHILEQFTGLHDQNGVEIYEGDILDSITGRHLIVVYSRDFAGFSMVYQKDASMSLYERYANKSIILGNIHVNPDLLK